MNHKIAVIKGDGIGPEVVASALAVLNRIADKYGHSFDCTYALAGGAAIDAIGEPLPAETIRICKENEAVLFGAVGGPKWDGVSGDMRPEKAILGLRSKLGLFANLRPAHLLPALAGASPLKQSITEKGIDIMFVRELTGGIYFGERGRNASGSEASAFDTECYSEAEVERIGEKAFELAMSRRGNLVSVDKANVLESSRLWREVMHRLSESYPKVKYRDMFVDNATMQLVCRPSDFDVVVTSNLFGDILTDEASAITGSIGLSPSASVGDGTFGLYEPIHGSAPDIAGQNKANPAAAILSAAMMLRHSFSLNEEAEQIERAVERAIISGARTQDLLSNPGQKPLSTDRMTETILNFLCDCNCS